MKRWYIFIILIVLFVTSLSAATIIGSEDEYHYSYLNSSKLGETAWEYVTGEENRSSISENFSYSVSLTNSWSWSIDISILGKLGLGTKKSDVIKITRTYNISIPPYYGWYLYKKTTYTRYYYKYWIETINIYDDGKIEVTDRTEYKLFYKTIISETTKTELKGL
ncbi:hypothetical protein X275_06920 [Marinitoga sp. 1197]|uniref:hypothetical protein n=1 Tax=Marinitoga sp. 1197 TaxID=1428449 RepID=UPI00064147E4|nr:hypothetical protein [Marinitoga sp. 1197]KLO22096.1 hypothetical protein X275_06920 [Marinitoga sp. 1197]